MTRRERLTRKAEKRGEWATKATGRSLSAFAAAHRLADAIPFGQPILVGHHSERRARKDQARIHGNMDRGVAEHRLAEHHEQKARGLEIQLERSIFSDDPDALEQLRAKIAELEQHCERLTRANKAWRKGGRSAVAAEFGENLAKAAEISMAPGYSWVKSPFNLTSDRAEIRRCRVRIECIEKQQARREQARAAGGVTVEAPAGVDWARVTFEDKPARDVLQALRDAGFRWGEGSWQGRRSKLPDVVSELVDAGSDVALDGEAAE